MILICPECATRYEIDSAKFPAAGRKVRCKKCSHVWFQPGEEAAPADDDDIVAVAEAEPAPVPEPAAEAVPVEAEPEHIRSWRASTAAAQQFDEDAEAPQPVAAAARRAVRPRGGFMRRAALAAGWIALIGAVLVIGVAAMSFHQQIAGAWPKSASLFRHMGMAVNTRGLDFADIRHLNQSEDGQPVLVITGKLVNVSAHQIKVPSLRVTLSNDKARAIYGWDFAPSAGMLAPGQAVDFRTRLSNPPAAARHVDIRFADRSE